MGKKMNGPSTKHKIFIIDDQPVVREGIAKMLEEESDLSICGEAADSNEALEKIRSLKPSIVITDLKLVNGGTDLAKVIRQQVPNARVLVFSQQAETLHAPRALAAGANGYLMRNKDSAALKEAVHRLVEGKTYVSSEVNECIISSLANSKNGNSPATIDDLSERERQVLTLIGRGFGSRQIADQLHMSIKTVETHRQHMKAKLGLSSTFQLVQRAIDWVHHQGGDSLAQHHPIA